MKEGLNQENIKHPTIDQYEKEKIENSIKDLHKTARQLEILLETAEFADKNNITIRRKNFLDKLRHQDAEFGSEGILHTELKKLEGKFIDEHLNMFNQFNEQQRVDFMKFANEHDDKEKTLKVDKDNESKEKKSAITKTLGLLLTIDSNFKSGKYDGENRGKIWPDMVYFTDSFRDAQDLYVSKELRDAENRINYLLDVEKDVTDLEDLKGRFSDELYKIKNDLLYEIDKTKEKPDWIKSQV